jgi:Zn finger protein HypA/HybF involved in hydrogenase expression
MSRMDFRCRLCGVLVDGKHSTDRERWRKLCEHCDVAEERRLTDEAIALADARLKELDANG